MNRWSAEKSFEWYQQQPWLVGCNYLPCSAVNQLEMWQEQTYEPKTIDRELGWAQNLGFNTLRVYLHDLVWHSDRDRFIGRIDNFLRIAHNHGMKILFTLFDDCHRPNPSSGMQPLPVAGVHNSGWMQSPGHKTVVHFHEGTLPAAETARLKEYIQGVLSHFCDDSRILMWDIYNEPGQVGKGDRSNALLKETWRWAREAAPSQPLTSCLDGSVGDKNIALNAELSDIITFHCYDGDTLEQTIRNHKSAFNNRPVICTEYMAREHGTTFQHSLPIFTKHGIGCYNWGLVAGKSQTHFNWQTVGNLESLKAKGAYLNPGDPIPEPDLWFHDILRIDGSPFNQDEVEYIKDIAGKQTVAVAASTANRG